jgi:hypothetical protein
LEKRRRKTEKEETENNTINRGHYGSPAAHDVLNMYYDMIRKICLDKEKLTFYTTSFQAWLNLGQDKSAILFFRGVFPRKH